MEGGGGDKVSAGAGGGRGGAVTWNGEVLAQRLKVEEGWHLAVGCGGAATFEIKNSAVTTAAEAGVADSRQWWQWWSWPHSPAVATAAALDELHKELNVASLSLAETTLAPTTAAEWDAARPTFYFVPAAVLLSCKAIQLPRMQELRAARLLVKRQIELKAAFHGEGLIRKILFVSHRWEEMKMPDRTGAQLQAMQHHLRAHSEIELVWFDYACMPQNWAPQGLEDGRSDEDNTQFGLMLQSITDLYLTSSVLILLDFQYHGRFWCLMEAWCAMMTATADGVRAATRSEQRYTIVCIHRAVGREEHNVAMLEELLSRTPNEMFRLLKSADVSVTNTRDKETMLPVVGKTDQHVRQIMRS